MTDKCPKCGSDVQRQEMFCSQCGTPLSKATLEMHGAASQAGGEAQADPQAAFQQTLLMGQVPDFVNDIPDEDAGAPGEAYEAQVSAGEAFDSHFDQFTNGMNGQPPADDGTDGAGGQDDDFGDDWRGKGGGGGKFRIVAMIAGAVVILVGLLIPIHIFLSPIKFVEQITGIESKLAGFKSQTSPDEIQKVEAPKPEPAPVKTAPDAGAAETVAAKGNCKPISEYPEFSNREYLKTILGGSGEAGVCALFDMSADEVASTLGDTPKLGPTGYDLLPNAEVLEVYPGGKLDRRQPRVELVFLEGKLFEVRLIYASPFDAMSVPESFEKGKFKEVFGEPAERKTASSIARTDFTDGDVLVSLIESKPEKKKGKKGKSGDKKTEPVSIAFAKKVGLESIGDADKKRQAALDNLAKGLEIFYSEKPDKAKKYWAKARKQIPDIGETYNLEARLALHKEVFKDAIKAAEQAEKSSRDARVDAEANEILSIVFVYLGKEKKAVSFAEKAVELDPAEPRYALAVEELKNGEYTTERVARAAALMSCKKKKRGKKWSTDGVLARTNFLKEKVYKKEFKKAKKSDGFKDEKERWMKLECP